MDTVKMLSVVNKDGYLITLILICLLVLGTLEVSFILYFKCKISELANIHLLCKKYKHDFSPQIADFLLVMLLTAAYFVR